MHRYLFFLIFFISSLEGTVPILFKGRFHPIESYGKLWLMDLYGRPNLKRADRHTLNLETSEELIWKLHFEGHHPFDNTPLFFIRGRFLKELLGLDPGQMHFSYFQLHQAVVESKETNLRLMQVLIPEVLQKHYADPNNRSRKEKLELLSVSRGLWVGKSGENAVIITAPSHPPWHHLHSGMVISPIKGAKPVDEALELIGKLQAYERFSPISEIKTTKMPLSELLQNAGDNLRALPAKQTEGEWISLHALAYTNLPNFTLFPQTLFEEIREAYLKQDIPKLKEKLKEGYASLQGKRYREGLHYPSQGQLSGEAWLFTFPWLAFCIALYGGAILLYPFPRLSFFLIGAAFLLHSLVLALRCYVLERPPVSNMFETVIYVPWIAVAVGILLSVYHRNHLVLAASSIVASALLIVLECSQLGGSVENVQAVLDSQYWLTVHVLMVVGSYGLFALAGALGHIYLIGDVCQSQTKQFPALSSLILQTMYMGTALLIPGTILGGVWAAQSWGRFWDWDPKESWAFISSSVYLIWIHLFRFHHIGNFGLAIGAVFGFTAISFTWYGVNYILGTGLHSYGFGSGGEKYYYLYLIFEILFIGSVLFLYKYNPRYAVGVKKRAHADR